MFINVKIILQQILVQLFDGDLYELHVFQTAKLYKRKKLKREKVVKQEKIYACDSGHLEVVIHSSSSI